MANTSLALQMKIFGMLGVNEPATLAQLSILIAQTEVHEQCWCHFDKFLRKSFLSKPSIDRAQLLWSLMSLRNKQSNRTGSQENSRNLYARPMPGETKNGSRNRELRIIVGKITENCIIEGKRKKTGSRKWKVLRNQWFKEIGIVL